MLKSTSLCVRCHVVYACAMLVWVEGNDSDLELQRIAETSTSSSEEGSEEGGKKPRKKIVAKHKIRLAHHTNAQPPPSEPTPRQPAAQKPRKEQRLSLEAPVSLAKPGSPILSDLYRSAKFLLSP